MIFEIVDLLLAFIGTAVAILLRKLVRVTAAAARIAFASGHDPSGH